MAYHTGNMTNIKKLTKIQERILKVIFNIRSNDVASFMKKFKIFNVTETYNYKLLCLGHKVKYNHRELPMFLQNIYKHKKILILETKKILLYHTIVLHSLRIA